MEFREGDRGTGYRGGASCGDVPRPLRRGPRLCEEQTSWRTLSSRRKAGNAPRLETLAADGPVESARERKLAVAETKEGSAKAAGRGKGREDRGNRGYFSRFSRFSITVLRLCGTQSRKRRGGLER